jgi:hypothetical protein
MYKTQLDKMLASGTIDEGQYQKGMLAVMTGNETLMQHILATPQATPQATVEKPNISNPEELDILRRPFEEKRKMLSSSLEEAQKDVVTFAGMPKLLASAQKQAANLQAQIDAQFAQENAAVDQFRKQGSKPAADRVPASPGTMSMSVGGVPVAIPPAAPAGTGTMTSQIPGTPLRQTGSLGKPLDKDTAMQFLQQAGGDNEKARALARLQGYAV